MASSIAALMAVIKKEESIDLRAKFLYWNAFLFLFSYGRGHFEAAAVYARRIAEVFCFIAHPDSDADEYYDGLCQMAWALPMWYRRAVEYIAEQQDLAGIGDSLGMGLPSKLRVWDDVTTIRRYGNEGAHASDAQMYGQPLQANDEAFIATVRIIVASLTVYRLTPMQYRARM